MTNNQTHLIFNLCKQIVQANKIKCYKCGEPIVPDGADIEKWICLTENTKNTAHFLHERCRQ